MEARRTCLISLEGDGQLSLVGRYEKALLAWWSRWAWFAMLGRNRRVLDEDLPVVDLMTLYIYLARAGCWQRQVPMLRASTQPSPSSSHSTREWTGENGAEVYRRERGSGRVIVDRVRKVGRVAGPRRKLSSSVSV